LKGACIQPLNLSLNLSSDFLVSKFAFNFNLYCYSECRDAIAPLLQQGYSVQLTGHSLGGAVAVAVALLYNAAGKDVTKVVTFGAPKLGPKETRDAAEVGACTRGTGA
jgi:pimeloyl-ACP methyl ester carboxylesterase